MNIDCYTRKHRLGDWHPIYGAEMLTRPDDRNLIRRSFRELRRNGLPPYVARAVVAELLMTGIGAGRQFQP